MKTLLALLVVLFVPACGAVPSAAEEIDEHRIELYGLIDAVRELDTGLADELLASLGKLELIADALDAADPSD